jgi:pyrimidine-nucleoside phosphorylase
MSSSLMGHLNHRRQEHVAEVMSQWLDDEEILPFIKTVKEWQEEVALPDKRLPKFASYSTGVSVDKVSLVLVPLVSSAGVVVSNISEPLSLLGPAWKKAFYNLANFNSHSNILQSIPGFQTSLDPKEIKHQLSRVGASLFSPPKQMASFFEKTYASKSANSWQDIRDSLLGCFMSSILLGGVNGASFDIKVGEGSFLKNLQEARSLALSLKNACDRLKINASFILSDMNQPLGQAMGNSLEVREVLEVLKGKGPLDVLKLSLELGTEILLLAKKSSNRTEAKRDLKDKIIKGEALEKLKETIEAQKGNHRIIDDYSLLPQAKNRMKIISAKKGFIHKIMMRQIRSLCLELETSGKKPTDSLDRGPGLLIFKKFGEKVEKGETLAEVHFNKLKNISRVEKESLGAFIISEKPPDFRPFIYERILTKV